MKPHAHEEEEEDRDLFVRRARAMAVDAQPPPFASVMAAIDRDQRARRTVRHVPRVVMATLAAAACAAGIFATARALAPEHERIVSDRGDASAPSEPVRAADPERVGGATWTFDRSLTEPSEETCPESLASTAAAAAPVSPAPLASYARLEPICTDVSNGVEAPSGASASAMNAVCGIEATCSVAGP